MTGSFHLGQFMGKALLIILFVTLLTPIALMLRIARKDLLGLRRRPDAASYWAPAKSTRHFDRMY